MTTASAASTPSASRPKPHMTTEWGVRISGYTLAEHYAARSTHSVPLPPDVAEIALGYMTTEAPIRDQNIRAGRGYRDRLALAATLDEWDDHQAYLADQRKAAAINLVTALVKMYRHLARHSPAPAGRLARDLERVLAQADQVAAVVTLDQEAHMVFEHCAGQSQYQTFSFELAVAWGEWRTADTAFWTWRQARLYAGRDRRPRRRK